MSRERSERENSLALAFLLALFRLFVRASHAFARGAFFSPIYQNDLALIPANLPESSHFLRSVPSEEPPPTPPRTHGLAFCVGFSPLCCCGAVRRGSAPGRAQAAVGARCGTVAGARRCRKEAAEPGNSGGPRPGERRDPAAMRFYAQLNSNQSPDVEALFLLFLIFRYILDQTSTLCSQVDVL